MIIYDKEQFVDMMAVYVEALGYTDVTKKETEAYVNLTAKKDGKLYAFACRYDIDAISATKMNEFIDEATKMKADVMVFMTNSSFSSAAKKVGDTNRVWLWDRNYIDRVSIGLDVEISKPNEKKEDRRGLIALFVIIAIIIVAAALIIYFNPNLIANVKK